MLSPRRLNNIDFSPLRENPDNLFTLRFTNLDEESRRTLATRIKETAPQYTVRKPTGPDIQAIYETLMELNPIIFSEYQRDPNERNSYLPRNSYRNFNISTAHYISGYNYHRLCEAIYYTLCLKKPLIRPKIQKIARTISSNWQKVNEFLIENQLDQLDRIETESTNQEPNIPDNNIGLEDIEEARRSVEQNGANTIPEGMRENSPRNPKLKIPTKYHISLDFADELDSLKIRTNEPDIN